MTDLNDIASYDYNLPINLIAQLPAEKRHQSRLMIVHKHSLQVEHRAFSDITQFFAPGDCLVLNNTRVVPARIKGYRQKTGGKWEGLFLSQLHDGTWKIIGHSGGKLLAGETICINSSQPHPLPPLEIKLIQKLDAGVWIAKPLDVTPSLKLLDDYGELPLPPYINREQISPDDLERYQTVYAQNPGSVAAPTAGLHFTTEILHALQEKGVHICHVTLHVGIGTFRPVNVSNLNEHNMHHEYCEVPADSCTQILQAKNTGHKIFAVGTTVVRTLESAALAGELRPFFGETQLFIKPPFKFNIVDALITNYHLPKSTLLILVSTLAGYETIKHAYETAVNEQYRFFSYGDAMLIF
jgi:S-adenosylmethionine:tRNA ribosyltransferase-isomerase